MKKPNKKITRLVVWTVAGSLSLNSCINVVPNFNDEDFLQEVAGIGPSAIRVNMTQEQVEYCKYLHNLAIEILQNREFAKEFSAKPEAYLRNMSEYANINAEVNIVADEELMRIIKALADDDIAQAINNNDVKQYLLLMYQKGYLKQTSNNNSDFLTLEEKKKVLKSVGVNIDELSDEYIQQMALVTVLSVFYIAALAISYAGLAYTATVVVNVAAGYTFISGILALTSTKVSGSGTEVLVTDDFDIWMLSQDHKQCEYILSDIRLQSVVNDVVEAYKEIYSDEVKLMDTDRIRQTLNLNLSKQEIISDDITITED